MVHLLKLHLVIDHRKLQCECGLKPKNQFPKKSDFRKVLVLKLLKQLLNKKCCVEFITKVAEKQINGGVRSTSHCLVR